MTVEKFQYSLAVVIGIDDYRNGVPSLKTPVNDAQTLATILKDRHGYDVKLLLNEAANGNSLKDLLETELPQRLNKDDRLLFYFAGHGIALNGDDGPEGYLIPSDARLGDISTYVSMATVNQALLKLSCRHFLGILDCCFAGAFRWSSTRKLVPIELGTIHKERFDRFIRDPAWQVITSAASDQFAQDAFDLKSTQRGLQGNHSPFAAALIEALEGNADAYPPAEAGKPAGDGVITATELYLYLRDRVEPDAETRAMRQTPGIFPLIRHDKGEFIFLSPGHPLNLPPAPPLDESSNPYRGLESFDEAHKDLFFGRQALTQTLAEFVTNHALTVVLGASGSGKSSLVKAGLIPKLQQEDDWAFLSPFRPGESPFKTLNQALQVANLPEIAPADKATSLGLLTPDQGLSLWFQEHPHTHLLVVVDQFEELITLCRDQQERKNFLDVLAEAIASHPTQLHLVLTLRSDFEPQFRNTALEPHWQGARFVVPAMTRDELRQAIEAPASARVMVFDPHELVDQLIDEVANMPGALPLLSFALSELYLNYLKRQKDARDKGETLDRAMTQADYEAMGGVTQSLTQRADQEYETLVQQNKAYEQTIRHVMLRMVAVGGGELARRQVPLSELQYPSEKNSLVKEVIERFIKARLLVKGENTEGNPYVEPAHDALVRGWQKLLEWKRKEQESLLLQRRLTPAAEEWQSQQKARFLWNANPRLDLLKKVLNSDDNWLNQIETQFVRRSVSKKRSNAIVRWSIAGSVLLGSLIFSTAIWQQLQITQLREKAARSRNLLATDPIGSLVIAIDAIGQNRNTPIVNMNVIPEVQSSLLSAIQTARESDRFNQPVQLASNQQGQPENNQQEQQGSQVIAVAVSPDGKTFASADKSGNIYRWDSQGKQIRLPLVRNGQSWGFSSLSFSPDGNILIGSGEQKMNNPSSGQLEVKIWDLQQNKLIQPFGSSYSSKVIAAAFSPDGKMIVSGGKDGTIRLWDLQGNQISQSPEIKGPKIKSDNPQVSHIHAVAFSPDGRSIVSADSERDVRLWKLQGGKVLESPTSIGKCGNPSGSSPHSVAFSSNNQQVLCNLKPGYSESGSNNESFVTLWNFDSQDNKWKTLALKGGNSGFLSKVLFASYSPNGKTIVTGDQDGSIRLWDSGGNPIGQPLLGHSSNVESIAFSSDGKEIISGSWDGSIRLWDVEQNLSEEKSFSNQGTHLILSPDGQKVAIGGKKSDNQATVTLLNIIKGNQIGQISIGSKRREESGGDYENGNPLAVSPNGYIVFEDFDNQSRPTLWHPEGTPEKQPIGNPETKVGRSIVISPDSQRIVSNVWDKIGDSDSYIQLWDIQGNPIGQPVKNDQGFSVASIAFSPDGQQIVTGSTNGSLNGASSQSSVCLLHLKVDGLDKKEPCPKILGRLIKVAFSPDNKTVAIGQSDGGLYLWNLQNNTMGQRFGGTGQPVLSIAFSPDNKIIASGDRDGNVRLWNLVDGTPIGEAFKTYTNPNKAVSSIAFNKTIGDGKTVIVAYTDGSVRFWQTAEEALLKVACNRLRDHPVFKDPKTEAEKGAKEACEKYAWNSIATPKSIESASTPAPPGVFSASTSTTVYEAASTPSLCPSQPLPPLLNATNEAKFSSLSAQPLLKCLVNSSHETPTFIPLMPMLDKLLNLPMKVRFR